MFCGSTPESDLRLRFGAQLQSAFTKPLIFWKTNGRSSMESATILPCRPARRALNRMTPATVAREAFIAACLEADMAAVGGRAASLRPDETGWRLDCRLIGDEGKFGCPNDAVDGAAPLPYAR